MTNTGEDERAAALNIVELFLPLFSQKRWDEWIELWSDNGVLEFPFAPPGRRNRYVGKADILAYMTPVAGKMKVDEILITMSIPCSIQKCFAWRWESGGILSPRVHR